MRVEGIYEPVRARKGPSEVPFVPKGASNAGIRVPGAGFVMLGVYHQPSGLRPLEEVRRLSGRRVAAVGVLHRLTPGPGATLMVPYLEPLEQLLPLDEPDR